MRYLISLFASVFLLSGAAMADDKADISAVLDQLHDNAATASWDAYFDLFADDAVYFGTDVTERWEKPVFESYASKTKGWLYVKRERNIGLTPDGNSAWFDEILDNKKYGTSRGTGMMIRTPAGWKILQYNLTFPIPNDLAAGFTQQIQTFEARQKTGQH